MIGIDTNVLIRHLVGDDATQAERAGKLLREKCTPDDPGFVNRIVLCEVAWTLDRTYGYNREQIAGLIEALVVTRELEIEDRDQVASAIKLFRRSNIGFSDTLIAEINLARGCDGTATFDGRASRIKGFFPVP